MAALSGSSTLDEFEREIRLHWGSMLQLAARLVSWSEAEDVVQEAALGAFRHWDRFVALYYYLDLPVRDVAAAMSCRDGTVQATLASARNNLGNSLRQDRP